MNNSILRKTLTSSTATFGILAGIGIVTSPAQAAVITNGCAATDSCTLTELFNGSSIQIGQKLLTDWSLVTTNVTGTATNFNFDNILVTESLFNIDGPVYLVQNDELTVLNVGSKSFSYDFKVTSLGNDIIETAMDLGFRGVIGPTGLVTGSIDVGTVQGSNDIGSATSSSSLGGNIDQIPISVPKLPSIWINTDISVSSNFPNNGATLGRFGVGGTPGPAYAQPFILAETTPEPTSILSLLTLGTLGTASTLKRKLKPSKSAEKETAKAI